MKELALLDAIEPAPVQGIFSIQGSPRADIELVDIALYAHVAQAARVLDWR